MLGGLGSQAYYNSILFIILLYWNFVDWKIFFKKNQLNLSHLEFIYLFWLITFKDEIFKVVFKISFTSNCLRTYLYDSYHIISYHIISRPYTTNQSMNQPTSNIFTALIKQLTKAQQNPIFWQKQHQRKMCHPRNEFRLSDTNQPSSRRRRRRGIGKRKKRKTQEKDRKSPSNTPPESTIMLSDTTTKREVQQGGTFHRQISGWAKWQQSDRIENQDTGKLNRKSYALKSEIVWGEIAAREPPNRRRGGEAGQGSGLLGWHASAHVGPTIQRCPGGAAAWGGRRRRHLLMNALFSFSFHL